MKLSKPIYIALTHDEEIGCLGAKAMAEQLLRESEQKPLVIVGEPTLMQPVVAQKGITTFRSTVYGEAAHSSQVSQGISAIHVGAKLVNEIEQVMQKLIADGKVDDGFNVPFSSLHVGMIHGGTAVNVKARQCSFDWEIRHLPSQTMEEVMSYVDKAINDLKKQYPNLEVITECLNATVPALSNQDNEHILSLVTKHLSPDVKQQYVAYATEAGTFQQHGFETIILGPGSIEQAHQPDEWIAISQIDECNTFLNALVNDYCA